MKGRKESVPEKRGTLSVLCGHLSKNRGVEEALDEDRASQKPLQLHEHIVLKLSE